MNGPNWTSEEIALLHSHYPTLGARKCHKFLPRRTVAAIRRKANDLGLVTTERNVRPYEGVAAPAHHERLESQGYVLVKVANRRWELKHRLVWERHYGEKPPGPLEFIDGDRTNCDISNLRLTTKAAQLRQNSIHRLPEDLRQVIHLKANLTKLIRRQQHEQHDDTTS